MLSAEFDAGVISCVNFCVTCQNDVSALTQVADRLIQRPLSVPLRPAAPRNSGKSIGVTFVLPNITDITQFYDQIHNVKKMVLFVWNHRGSCSADIVSLFCFTFVMVRLT